MAWLLDTCILIDLLRRNADAHLAIAAAEQQPNICAVSIMELYAGARSQREEARVDAIVGFFKLVAIDASVFHRAGSLMRHYRASHSLDIPDALIAATAEHHGLKLATLNVKHFPMFPRLKAAY
jgi:predicted nucleic acid-binding protein